MYDLYDERINKFINKLNFKKEDIEYFNKIVYPIISHEEFQRRLTDSYLHHDDITDGEHILKVALSSYKKALKKKCNKDLVIYIAMFHDLYTEYWQNNPKNKQNKFYNKHGFRHPIEAVVNSTTWFPEIFNNNEANIIIDGIVHHMWPFPVRRIDKEDIELRNKELFDNMNETLKNYLINSSSRKKFFKFSFALANSKEGRIVSIQDKKISCFNDLSLTGYIACLTGKNKKIKKG